jgi:hypothetical protein
MQQHHQRTGPGLGDMHPQPAGGLDMAMTDLSHGHSSDLAARPGITAAVERVTTPGLAPDAIKRVCLTGT